MRRLVMTVVITFLIAFLLRPLYMNGSECNWLLLWIIVGIPFGMHRMMAIVLPRGYDLGGTIGFFVLGLLISGIVGGVCVVFNVISGILQTGRRIYKRF